MTGDPALLRDVFRSLGPIAIAVSGGVDSMTLALAAERAGLKFDVYHAVSPAVPDSATRRVRRFSSERSWRLREISADEFNDPQYLRNPRDRCYYCKSNLYRMIRSLTDAAIVSGTNLDDLDDYRPGLAAAAQFDVRHPFVEAGLRKVAVRRLARSLGFATLAELPASPCLASRIETGLPIESAVLPGVDSVERFIRDLLQPDVVRCRVRREGVSVELDERTLVRLTAHDRAVIDRRIYADLQDSVHKRTVVYSSYSMGSAFLAAESGA